MALAVLPLILGITFIIVFLGKEKFGYSVPISVILSSLFLYFSQILLSTFSVGLFAFILIGSSGWLLAIISFFRIKKSPRSEEAFILFFSPGFYAFLIVFFFAFIAYGGRHFSAWDELSHWGPMVKEMIRLDRFYIVPEARYMAHKDYPPIVQLFEYLICRFDGGYSEGKASMGIQLVLLSFIVPSLAEKATASNSGNLRKRVGANLFLGLLMLVLTVLLFLWFDGTDVYRTIMNDCVVCAVGIYTLSLSLDEDILINKTKKVFLILSLFYLPLCKQIALAFVLLVYLSVVIALIQGRKHRSGSKISLFVFVLTVFIMPLLSLKLWTHIIKPYNLSAQFDLTEISVPEVVGILVGRGTWEQHTTYMKFVASLLTGPLTTGPLALGYISLCVFALFLLTWMSYSTRKISEGISTRVYIKYVLVFAAGIIGYAFTMFVMYMYGFSEGEMLGLASFSRYMATYTCLMFFLLLSLFLSGLDQKSDMSQMPLNKHLIIAALTVSLFILVGQERLIAFIPKILGNETREYQELARDIDNHVEYDDKVLLVSDNNNMYYPFLSYYCDDAVLSGKEYWDGVPEDELASFEYIYIINANDYQNEQWGRMLEHSEDTIQPGAYAVVNVDGVYKLRSVQ